MAKYLSYSVCTLLDFNHISNFQHVVFYQYGIFESEWQNTICDKFAKMRWIQKIIYTKFRRWIVETNDLCNPAAVCRNNVLLIAIYIRETSMMKQHNIGVVWFLEINFKVNEKQTHLWSWFRETWDICRRSPVLLPLRPFF